MGNYIKNIAEAFIMALVFFLISPLLFIAIFLQDDKVEAIFAWLVHLVVIPLFIFKGIAGIDIESD